MPPTGPQPPQAGPNAPRLDPRAHAAAPTSPMTRPQAPQGQRPQGNPVQSNPIQGNPTHGGASQGGRSLGNPTQGNPTQGNPTQGNPTQGNPTQGNPTHGGLGQTGPTGPMAPPRSSQHANAGPQPPGRTAPSNANQSPQTDRTTARGPQADQDAHRAGQQQPPVRGPQAQPPDDPTSGFQVWALGHDPKSPDVAPPDVRPRRSKRRARTVVISLVVLIVVAALAIGGGVVMHNRSIPRGPLPATGPQIAVPVPALGDVPATAPMPSTAGLAAALAVPLKQPNLGSHVSVEVADLATGAMLYGHGETSPTTPASTLKLATTIAVLDTRGPNYRITTNVVAGPKPGQVVIVGAGDPTLTAGAVGAYPEAGRLQDLAAQVKQALGGVKPTKVIVDTSLYSGSAVGPGWDDEDVHSTYLTSVYALSTDGGKVNPKDLDYGVRYENSATGAADAFARYLGLPASAVVSGVAPQKPDNPSSPTAPGAVLGSVQSAPLVRIIETMLANSDNMLAEAMARQVALATGHPASFAGAAAAVTEELTKLGMPMDGVDIVDGSGISHSNRVTPELMTAILAYAASPDHPEMHAMFTGLPVAGYSGTLATRFKHAGMADTFGMIRAKTGTLDGVSALAGYVVDASGRTLILVVLTDQAPAAGVTTAIDGIGAAVRQCGCD